MNIQRGGFAAPFLLPKTDVGWLAGIDMCHPKSEFEV